MVRLFKTIILIAAIISCSVTWPAAADSGIEVSFTRPVNDLVLDAGYGLHLTVTVTPAGASVQSLRLYKNNVLEYEQPRSANNVYAFECPDMLTGNYVFTAVAVMSSGDMVESVNAKNVVVANLIQKEVANETFDRFRDDQRLRFTVDATNNSDVGAEYVIENFNYNLYRRGLDKVTITDKESEETLLQPPAAPDGEDWGEALYARRNDREDETTNPAQFVYTGPGLGGTAGTIAAGSKIAMETDIYLRQTNQSVVPLAFRKGKTTGADQIVFIGFDRDGHITSSTWTPGQKVPYSANKWHKFRIEVDLAGKIFDVYLDGERVFSQIEFTTHGDFDRNGVVSGCIQTYIYFTKGGTIDAYFDNMKMIQYIIPPLVSRTQFIKDGKVVWNESSNVPTNAGMIDLRFNSTVSVPSLTNKVKLFRVENGIEYPVPFTEDLPAAAGDEMAFTTRYGMVLSGSLRQNAQYRARVEAGVTNNQGESSRVEQLIDFFTERPEVYVSDIEFSAGSIDEMSGIGNAVVQIVNNGMLDKTVKVVVAVYQGKTLQSIRYTDVDAVQGTSTETVPINTGAGATSVSIFAWPDLVMFNPYYTNVSLN